MDEPIALEAYKDFGVAYAEAIETNAYNAHYERPSSLSLIPTDLKGLRVLDAGCGPGVYARILLDRGATVVGIDVSPEMLEIAKEKNRGRAEFFLHDLAEPMHMFESNSFDFIVSSLAIHYISNLDNLFAELSRVLKDKGQAVISTHHPFLDFVNSSSTNYFAKELIEETWDTIGRPVKVKFFRRSLSEIVRAMTNANFLIERMHEGVITDELKELYPEIHERLSKNPGFLFFRLKKIA